MTTAKVFEIDGFQAVSIPERFRLPSDEVIVQQSGHSLILTPKDKTIDTAKKCSSELPMGKQ